MRLTVIPLAILVGACSAPDLDVPPVAEAARGAPPQLIPIEDIAAPGADRLTPGGDTALAARAAALRARAREMSGEVLTPGERGRLQSARE